MPTRSLDCILGLGSCRWLDPAQVSANPAVQAKAGVFAMPETLHLVLGMGQGSHLTICPGGRGYLLTACAA